MAKATKAPFFFSARRYTRGTAEDASAENKSSGETSVDVAPTKTEHSESSYRVCTSLRADETRVATAATLRLTAANNDLFALFVESFSFGFRRQTRATTYVFVQDHARGFRLISTAEEYGLFDTRTARYFIIP